MMIRRRLVFCFVLFLLVGAACTPPMYVRHPVAPGDTYFSWITWYGDGFSGRPTASGEPYDPAQYTCAAAGFPFGTLLEIRDMDTGKAVVVRVTDRPGDRVVDLTPAAFKALSPEQKGRLRGKVTVVGLPGENRLLRRNESGASARFFTVQLGAFSSLENARAFIKTLEHDIADRTYIYLEQGNRALYRVRVGRFPDRASADSFKEQRIKGHEALVVEVVE